MKFEDNPYYSPELCGLEIFEDVNTADSYEYDIFCIWRKLDDNTLWYDTDAGCSCPSPFDNGDHGHDLKQITPDTLFGFEEALKNHRDISQQTIIEFTQKVKQHLKGMEPTNINEENAPLYSSGYEARGNKSTADIQKSNKLIAEFMGLADRFVQFEYENADNRGVRYHNSWDWLMPVVEKIERDTEAVFQIHKRAVVCIYDYNKWQINESIDLRHQYNYGRVEDKLAGLYTAVISFIKWYNEQAALKNTKA